MSSPTLTGSVGPTSESSKTSLALSLTHDATSCSLTTGPAPYIISVVADDLMDSALSLLILSRDE